MSGKFDPRFDSLQHAEEDTLLRYVAETLELDCEPTLEGEQDWEGPDAFEWSAIRELIMKARADGWFREVVVHLIQGEGFR